MKKVFSIIVLGLFLVSCGESTETKPVKATQDSVGSAGSVASPAPTESSKTEVNEEIVETEQDIK